MENKTSLESTALVGSFQQEKNLLPVKTKMQSLIPGFLRHGQYEMFFSPQTVQKYKESLEWIVRDLGDIAVEELEPAHITILKQKIIMRGAGEARVASMVFALKSFLKYCKGSLELKVMDTNKIKSPRRSRRDVVYLSNEEVQQYVNSIKIENKWDGNTRRKCIYMDGLRLRALVEVLLGTGMRISEALSLDRDSINFEAKEAKIVGKGNKERIVFFTDRSLYWVKYYLEQRKDKYKPLFITNRGTRWSKMDISKIFQRQAVKAGINKKITPHILRHTTATNLLFNGCPMAHIKEILGHSRLETTCRYYLGLDKRKAKEAHGHFLSF
jgi:site-specific recombinase XerD